MIYQILIIFYWLGGRVDRIEDLSAESRDFF